MNVLAIPMTPIKAYSINHILIVLGIIVTSILLGRVLNYHSCQAKTVLTVCGCILVIMEVFKQLLLTYVRGGSYSWSDFPFQLCSTPMYLCFVYLFVPKLRSVISDFIMVYGFIGAIASFIIPYSSFYSYLLLTLQSLIWHGILLSLSIFLFQKKKKKPMNGEEMRMNGEAMRMNVEAMHMNGEEMHMKGAKTSFWNSFLKVSILYLFLSAIAVCINATTYNISGGTTNMFFFGPGFPNVGILNRIKDMYGWIIETIVMGLASLAAGFTVLLFLYYYIPIFEKKTIQPIDQ